MKRMMTAGSMIMSVLLFSASFGENINTVYAAEDEITLRICNWEEYIDEGDWDEEEAIELENGKTILSENSLITDFETWYEETYGKKIHVEYSCAGTNEDLYNQLNLGDVYDLICPSEYMFMKLMTEKKLEPFTDDFFDESNENNYYIRGLSPYIRDIFENNEIGGESWSRYSAGYMWGITGVLYNADKMTAEEASTWEVFRNPDFYRQTTIKDNVRDSYFAALGACKREELMSEEFRSQSDYKEKLQELMNDVSPETITLVQDVLQDMRAQIYSFETDSGKADIISGKITAGYQWSGDAVYCMDLADENDVCLKFEAPEECTNLWFDGFCMLKAGVHDDPERIQAAQAFINYISMPENVVRNMYYIGYTSVISGGEDDTVFDYLNYCYGAEEDAEETAEYPLGFFFSGDKEDPDYVIEADASQIGRQLTAQYPSEDVLDRCVVMSYFDEDANKNINQMWINVRCFNLNDVPVYVWGITAVLLMILIGAVIYMKKNYSLGEEKTKKVRDEEK